MHSISDLHRYQRDAADYALVTPRCALMMGLGLGKTITALTVITIETYTGVRQRTLIIAPLRVANTVWKQEAANWSHTRDLRFSVATGSLEQRLEALHTPADVYVINTENVPWLVQNFPRSKWIWDSVVIDESSWFKNPASSRFKHLYTAAVDKVGRSAKMVVINRKPVKRMMLLTATPVTNGLEGLWSQMALIDGGRRLTRSFTAFIKQYFHKPPFASRYAKPVPNAGAKQMIFNAVADRVYILKTEDHIEMPELITQTISLPISKAVRDQYNELEREFLLELHSEEGLQEVLATNEGALANKLLQFANGHVYTGETPTARIKNRDYSVVHNAKIDALKELVESAAGAQNLLVAYYYQSDLDRLCAAFPQAKVMDEAGELVAPWNRGEIPILLAQPLSSGLGLNLQHGGSTCVFFSLLWHLEAYQQFIGRLYRQGQKHTVTVQHLTIENTIEQRVLNALRSKAQTQAEFLQALRRLSKSKSKAA